MSDTYDTILAAYPSAAPAHKDFDPLCGLIKTRAVQSEGVILVQKDPDGKVQVTQTGDHPGRKGLGWGGGGSVWWWGCSLRRCWPRSWWAGRPTV